MHAKLQRHWARSAAECLTEKLCDLDVMGLVEGGAPANEFEPEALLALAKICGVGCVDALLALPRPPTLCANAKALVEAITESFEELLGRSPEWSDRERASLQRAAEAALSEIPQQSRGPEEGG
ncbi:hypothetical protein EBZ37_09335 [bacterium]|nr:hypothetical protein [bacterium]